MSSCECLTRSQHVLTAGWCVCLCLCLFVCACVCVCVPGCKQDQDTHKHTQLHTIRKRYCLFGLLEKTTLHNIIFLCNKLKSLHVCTHARTDAQLLKQIHTRGRCRIQGHTRVPHMYTHKHEVTVQNKQTLRKHPPRPHSFIYVICTVQYAKGHTHTHTVYKHTHMPRCDLIAGCLCGSMYVCVCVLYRAT